MHLALFFTRGVSLQAWAQNGSLQREIALYLRLKREKDIKVSFITYGGKEDLQYPGQLDGVEILCNRWNLPLPLYELLIPFLHANMLRRSNIIKTNQTNGADVALRAAMIWRKPLIARCGYMWSFMAQADGHVGQAKRAREIERIVFSRARRVIVTTPFMRDYVIGNYGGDSERVHVIPNYVLTDVFSTDRTDPVPNRISFVGRLCEQKNLFSLIHACAGIDVDLHFVGEGPLRSALQASARESNVRLHLHGNLPHEQLPEVIRKSALFALVSSHEGHPKSLLEAMSCGAAVLAADSPGIREQIIHGETGWLVRGDAKSIREGIIHLLANRPLREKLGLNARRFILENYSLNKIVEDEYALYLDTLSA